MSECRRASADADPAPRPGVLLVGNFLSAQLGARSVGEDLAVRLRLTGWPVLTTSSKPSRIERLVDMISVAWRQRHSYEVAVVDVFSGPAFVWAEAVCAVLRRAGRPYVLTLRGGNLPDFSRRWPQRVRSLLKSAALVTVPSGYLAREMSGYRSDLLVLPNPIDLSLYHFSPRIHVRPMLVWLRAFHRIYNPSLAPRVIACLAPDFPDIELQMIGRDKGDGTLKETVAVAESLGVADRLRFPGGVPKTEVPERLGQADIFLNTTNVDNTPVSVLEALASGLCIVSTDVGGVPYLLENEVDALLIPPEDPEAMAAAVRRILSEPTLAERLSRNARAKAERYDWSVVLPQWEELLTSVANGTRK